MTKNLVVNILKRRLRILRNVLLNRSQNAIQNLKSIHVQSSSGNRTRRNSTIIQRVPKDIEWRYSDLRARCWIISGWRLGENTFSHITGMLRYSVINSPGKYAHENNLPMVTVFTVITILTVVATIALFVLV